jgi:hypothetical protein
MRINRGVWLRVGISLAVLGVLLGSATTVQLRQPGIRNGDTIVLGLPRPGIQNGR